MYRPAALLFGTLAWGFTLVTPTYAAEKYQCPEASVAHAAFKSEAAQKWPNYSEGAAARVQRQHPDTAIISAQSKFIEAEKGKFAICQYYTHIGLLITTGFFVADKGTGHNDGYWRSEYTESKPEQDVKGREMMEVCMEKKDELAIPSVNCQFILLDDK